MKELDQLDQLITTTFDKVRPRLTDNITTKVALTAFLDMKSQVREDGGITIRRPLIFELNDTVGSYSGYDLLDTTPQDGLGYAEYQWRQYAGSVTISSEEILKNSGVSQIINLLTAKFEQLELSFRQDLNRMLWSDGTGNGGKDFLGLGAIVDDTVILGGIDPATETWWQSAVVGGPVPLHTDIKGLNSMVNGLAVNNSKPDGEFTTQANFEQYENLAAPNIRFTTTRMAELGFESVQHKGAEVVFDPDVPTGGGGDDGGYWYFVNSKNLEFVHHSACWMKRTEFIRPYNQDAKTMLVLSMGQLITDCRRAHGLIKSTDLVA
jgi:hypothetical protein